MIYILGPTWRAAENYRCDRGMHTRTALIVRDEEQLRGRRFAAGDQLHVLQGFRALAPESLDILAMIGFMETIAEVELKVVDYDLPGLPPDPMPDSHDRAAVEEWLDA